MCDELTAKARKIFADDRFATECAGIEIIEAKPGYACCSMKIEPKHCNALGNPMGGAVFTLADFAFAVASNIGGRTTVSQACQISFLSAAKGKVLTARASAIKSGRSTCFYQAEVTDELGTKVAFATTDGFVVDKAK